MKVKDVGGGAFFQLNNWNYLLFQIVVFLTNFLGGRYNVINY